MDLNVVLREKKEKNLALKKSFWLIQKNKALWLIKLSNKALIKDLRDWFLSLPVSFVVQIDWIETELLGKNIVATSKVDDKDLIWFDFIVCDDEIENLSKYLEKWVAPIISNNSHLASILREYNPVKNEGNTYFYENTDKWNIFYSIVRYMENYKFPFDNKNLVKNILSI